MVPDDFKTSQTGNKHTNLQKILLQEKPEPTWKQGDNQPTKDRKTLRK